MLPYLDVRTRVREPEIMDQPGLDESMHVDALRGLERINRWSFAPRVLWSSIRELMPASEGPLRVLDVATGAGDAPIYLWQKARQKGWPIRLDACDKSHTALEHARRCAAQAGAAIHFFEWDVLAGPFPESYDVVMCSLFMHHLDEDKAIQVLHNMAKAARKMVLVHDLSRSSTGLLVCYLGTHALSRSPVVRVDGPLSVRAAFTPAEARQLAKRAGMENASVTRSWPFRWLLRWRRNFAEVPTAAVEAAWSAQPLGQAAV